MPCAAAMRSGSDADLDHHAASTRSCTASWRVVQTILNGLYKAELIYRRGPWKRKEAVELATLEWVH